MNIQSEKRSGAVSQAEASSQLDKGYIDLAIEKVSSAVNHKFDEYVALKKSLALSAAKQNVELFNKNKFVWKNPSRVKVNEISTKNDVSSKVRDESSYFGTVIFAGILIISPAALLLSASGCSEADQGSIPFPNHCQTIDEEIVWDELQLKRQAYEFHYKNINRDFAKGLIHFYDLSTEQEDIQIACSIGNPDFAIAGSCNIRVLMDAGVHDFEECDDLDELNDIYGEDYQQGDCNLGLACIDLERHPIVEFSYLVEGENDFGVLVEKWCYHTLRVNPNLTKSASDETQPLSNKFIQSYLEQSEYVDWKECEHIEGACRDFEELDPNNPVDRDEECQLRVPVGI